MALEIGNPNATSGMTKAIYDELRDAIEPDLGDVGEDALTEMRAGWRKMAHAIARGVISHLLSNMEVHGVEVSGNIAAAVSGNTAQVSSHAHSVNLTGTQSNVTFDQSNDGTGLVR